MFGDGPTSRSVSPSFESLEPRLLLDGGLENQAGPYLFEFSVDIGSDAELSDPNLNGNEAFDPGDVYLWRSGPVIPPGRDGFKDDAGIFDGRDPFPDPPDPNVPPATRVPVGQGGPENYGDFFDLDGHDQIDIYLPEFVPPDGPLGQPIPQGPSQCIFPAGYLMISMDDDMAWGWPAGDVPVTAPSPAGLTYGTTAGQDEIIGLIVAGSGPNSYIVVVQYGVADEAMVHLSLAPNPDKDPREDDDLDSLDILYDQGVCPFWYFSVDHEANLGGDPGDIYLATPGGPVKVIDEAIHLGIPEEVDIDAFEFVWLQMEPQGEYYLGLLFSVDDDDPLTKEDESGGGQPGMIYGSFLTGFSFPLLRQSLGDDVDAIANWHESLGPELDWGDAPEPAVAAGYPTTAGNNGANHVIGGPWLGDTTDNPDAEPDGQPDPNALGDDNDGNDDEDGVQMPVLIQGQPTTVPLEVNGAPAGGAWVDGWIDWNGDMTWDDASERVLLGGPVPDGVYSFGVMAPLGSVVGQTFARFRISSVGGLSPTGPAPDGEVEDYEVWIEEAQRDWGDAPDWAGAPMYPTTAANNGANHMIVIGGPWLGDATDNPDAEPDGQPDWNALGDDLFDGNDDEDGVVFTTPLVQGSTVQVQVTASGPGLLSAWLDFNADSDWIDAGEQIFTDVPLVAGVNVLTFPVYLSAVPGQTFARFRFSTAGGLAPGGVASDGEVEDYEVWIDEAPEMYKWVQPPEPAQPDNVYYGWNEYSVYGGYQIVADDWVCTTDAPVTDLHWWGSYIGWDYAWLPPQIPTSFHITIWTDVPADPGDPNSFSHPGQVIWELNCSNFTSQWVGWDFDPRMPAMEGELEGQGPMGTYESLFQFNQVLNPEEYFYQGDQPGTEPGPNIYWISIAAVYPGAPGEVQYPWGWKTRPREADSPAPDDAVMIYEPTRPVYGSQFGEGWPIEQLGISWDMAFELTTTEGVEKWRQEPNLEPTGMDVLAGPFVPEPTGTMWYEKFLADDFLCTESGLITQIKIWSSYLLDEVITAGLSPFFSLAIYSDVPVGPGGYSMPGELLWDAYLTPTVQQVYATNLPEHFYDPNQDAIVGPDWTVWEYTFDIEPVMAFNQEEGNIYWLGLHHSFDLDGNGVVDRGDVDWLTQMSPAGFGWKTTLDQWNDDAVWIDVDTMDRDPHVTPVTDGWRELHYPMGHPLQGRSIDLAFAITTEPDKWLQHPDLEKTGLDVLASYPALLADDWLCTQVGEIDQIIIWGSWYKDMLPDVGPDGVTFTLSIHDDRPAGTVEEWSVPGETLWFREFQPGSYRVREYASDLEEGWWDPLSGNYDQMGDTVCWIYVFDLYPGEFIQYGKPDEPMIYWLDVQASYDDPNAVFGWKTTPDHWNDDAVVTVGREPVPADEPGVWMELRYPSDHPLAGESIDLAFKIIGPGAKWSQPPQPYVPPDAFNGWDAYSVYGGQQIVADDWVCTEPGPVTDVHWWGSLLDWHEPYLPELPDGFVFTIWSDVPAGVDQPFSHPGQVLWQHYCDNYTWQFAGWDFDPRDPTAAPEATFYFEQDIPPDNWFWQEAGDNIYWISISARYDLAQPRYPFGWKTRPRDPASPAPDDAVRIFDPTDPVPGMIYIAGQPIEWPVGRSWDMAFELTTADVTPPTVVDVQVKGTTWAVPDYSIPVGSAAQVEPLGWSTINQIEVTFSEDVIVTQADLTLTGANVPVYNFAGFNYDPFNYIATWTLTGAIDTDKLLIDVSAATVQDYAGNALDGEWTDTVSVYPSGNGVAGGNFQFTFKVLPGNANTDNKVDGLDYNAWSLNYNQPATTYKQGDFNADAFTDGLDYNIWSLHYNQEISLPPEAEAAAGSSSLPSLPGRGRGRAQANFVEAMWRARRGAEHGVNSRKGANDSLDLLELPNLLALSAGILNLV